MRIPTRLSYAFVIALLLVGAMPVQAATVVTFLGINGMLGPGSAGNYPLDANFSWISHRFPGNTSAHIWTLAPGSDGGVIMNAAQPGQGRITAPRPMYNVTSWLFSTGSGIRFNPQTEVMDFTRMRLAWGEDIYDFGFGATRSGLVPHIAGPQAAQNANGWWLDTQGKYHLIFRGDGQCVGCELTVHLTGQMTTAVLGDLAPKGALDGRVNVAYLMRLMRFVVALEVPSGQDVVSGDINGDSVLDARDALALGAMLGY